MDCTCEKCVKCCKTRPCWGTPDEIGKLIAMGLAGKLMEDYWVGDGDDGGDIIIICPACEGHEGGQAPGWVFGPCVLLNGEDRCTVHEAKPIEARETMACGESADGLHESTAMTWNTEEGRKVVKWWRGLVTS